MERPKRIKFNVLWPAILFSALSLVLLIIRLLSQQSIQFWFMGWNLFLAWFPLLFAYWLEKSLRTDRWLSLKNAGISFLWLAFMPNSFYMVTDLIHIKKSTTGSLLLDAAMFMSFAITGLLLGCMSVYLVHRQLAKRTSTDMTWAFLLGFFLLSAVAVYLGRNMGWNSWDLILNPFFIVFDISSLFTSAERLSVSVGITILFFGFITTTYLAFYSGLRSIRRLK
jgi:uncharacterized membrane protein